MYIYIYIYIYIYVYIYMYIHMYVMFFVLQDIVNIYYTISSISEIYVYSSMSMNVEISEF